MGDPELSQVYTNDDGDFFNLVKLEGGVATVESKRGKSSQIPISELTLQRRDAVLAPDELLKRALRLLSDPIRYILEPNREVWKSVLTHGGRDFTPDFPQWLVDDEELFILAIRGCPAWQLSYQLTHITRPHLNIPESVSEPVLVELKGLGAVH